MQSAHNLNSLVHNLQLGPVVTEQVTSALLSGDRARARDLLFNVRGDFLANIMFVGRERFSSLNKVIDAIKV